MGILMYNQSQKFNNNRERIGCLNGSYLNSSGSLVNRVNSTDDIEILITCNMWEELDSTNTTTSGSNKY